MDPGVELGREPGDKGLRFTHKPAKKTVTGIDGAGQFRGEVNVGLGMVGSRRDDVALGWMVGHGSRRRGQAQ